ncbi:hypothetical protein DES32_0962 [Methylovirgula ligni]|uniref:Uncharacterized protein n=1 Tax=Methylovirgula ligni TaxID=569860 RepID=A0A3D9YXD2_9HYPH|nr:DUF6134 family protein [Methylovirgula ligni]REF87342.1 hypothetical protein DES32_0962 [Methylovirgula ligni]
MLGKHTLLLGLFALFPFGVAAQSAGNDAVKAAEPPAASAAIVAPTTEERVFDITRDGNKIGTQIVDITRDGDETTVKFKTHIEVEIMFVVVHRFDHIATEIWNGGKFVSYKAFTKENSDVNKLTAVAKGDKIALTVNGEEKDVDGNLVFASFWKPDFVGQKALLHPDTGHELAVEVADLGDDTITLKDGSSVKARHYKISGDIERDLWFDGDNLIRIKLFGSDHSTIVSELTSAKTN